MAQYQNIAITTNALDQSEVTIAISPLNPNYLMAAWNDFRSSVYSQPGYAFSTNSGSSWGVATLPNHGGFSYGFDPTAAFDKFGKAFYGHIASPPEQLGATYVSRTSTFTPPFTWDIHNQVSSATSGQDKPFIAMDNTGGINDGNIYISWTAFPDTEASIKFSRSTDHGVNFTPEIELTITPDDPGPNAYFLARKTSSGYPATATVQGSMPAVGPNGELYVIWMDINSGCNASSFKLRKSTNGGASFGAIITVTSFTYERIYWGLLDHVNIPSLAVDPSNGYVYVVYKDRESQAISTPRIKFVYSTNGGNNWILPPAIIGNLGEKGEVFPWVACDAYGKVAVTFMHRHTNNLVDCYVVESYDYGASFRPAVKVSGVSSDPENCTWTHHYQGMVLDNAGNNYVVWTDYRNGNADPYFAKVNTPPAALQNLTASAAGTYENVVLNWTANGEADLSKYKIDRALNYSPTPPSSGYSYLATINAYSGGSPVTSYTDWDAFAYSGSMWLHYKIRAQDSGGNVSGYSNIASYNAFVKIAVGGEEEAVISEYSLEQNHPNPFNPNTTIQFTLPEAQEVEIAVYNLTGQKIATLAAGVLEKGSHRVEWNGKDAQGNAVSSGLYIYQLKTGKQRMVKKMLLTK